MAISLTTVSKTAFGSIAGNTEMYTGANVDSLLSDLCQKIDAKLASAMHYKGTLANYAAIQAVVDPEVGDVYNATDTGKNYAWDGTAWDELTGIVDLSAYYTSAQVDTLLGGKVDKVEGKGLSANDFTDALKTKLDGIEAGAQVNIIESGDVVLDASNTVAGTIAGKKITFDLTAFMATKVDKIAGYGLSKNDFTDALLAKLNGIAEGAEVNVQADWDETDSTSDAFILNKPTLGALAAKDEVARTDFASALETTAAGWDLAVTRAAAIAAVTAPDAMPTKSTVTLYELYDEVASIRTAVAAIITAAGTSAS